MPAETTLVLAADRFHDDLWYELSEAAAMAGPNVSVADLEAAARKGDWVSRRNARGGVGREYDGQAIADYLRGRKTYVRVPIDEIDEPGVSTPKPRTEKTEVSTTTRQTIDGAIADYNAMFQAEKNKGRSDHDAHKAIGKDYPVAHAQWLQAVKAKRDGVPGTDYVEPVARCNQGDIDAFDNAVNAKVERGMPKAQAIRATVKEDPQRHANYLGALQAKQQADRLLARA